MKILLSLLLIFLLSLNARVITDHYERVVEVPQSVTKIFVASPSLSLNLLAFDANLVSGLNAPFSQEQKPYVGSAFDEPVVGGLFGAGQTLNYERVAALKPDVVVVWGRMSGVEKIVQKFSALKLPVLLVKNDSIKDLRIQFELYGELSGNTKRANELIAYTEETLRLIEASQTRLSQSAPLRYYFAEGLEGLSSECDGSFHLEPFLYAGAKNALDCKMSSNYGMEKVSAEQVILSDPDVIIAMEREFYKNIEKNPRFASLRAVKEKRVYLVPSEPFNYVTRPPSFMRLMGIRWLIGIFHPEILPEGNDAELKRFQEIFFHISL